MLIDVIYVKYLWIISGVACAIILSAFITGLAGPETYVHNEITSLDKGVFMGVTSSISLILGLLLNLILTK